MPRCLKCGNRGFPSICGGLLWCQGRLLSLWAPGASAGSVQTSGPNFVTTGKKGLVGTRAHALSPGRRPDPKPAFYPCSSSSSFVYTGNRVRGRRLGPERCGVGPAQDPGSDGALRKLWHSPNRRTPGQCVIQRSCSAKWASRPLPARSEDSDGRSNAQHRAWHVPGPQSMVVRIY